MANPAYITVSSAGSSPWYSINYHGYPPVNIGLAVRAGSTNWQIDVTMDDPFGDAGGIFNSSAGPTVFQSSQTNGTALSGSGNSIGCILQPIAALRLTVNSTTSGVATLTVLQAGIG